MSAGTDEQSATKTSKGSGRASVGLAPTAEITRGQITNDVPQRVLSGPQFRSFPRRRLGSDLPGGSRGRRPRGQHGAWLRKLLCAGTGCPKEKVNPHQRFESPLDGVRLRMCASSRTSEHKIAHNYSSCTPPNSPDPAKPASRARQATRPSPGASRLPSYVALASST